MTAVEGENKGRYFSFQFMSEKVRRSIRSPFHWYFKPSSLDVTICQIRSRSGRTYRKQLWEFGISVGPVNQCNERHGPSPRDAMPLTFNLNFACPPTLDVPSELESILVGLAGMRTPWRVLDELCWLINIVYHAQQHVCIQETFVGKVSRHWTTRTGIYIALRRIDILFF